MSPISWTKPRARPAASRASHALDLPDGIAGRAGVVHAVVLRVSPSTDPRTHRLTTTGVLDSKFGFPIETGQAKEAVQRAVNAKNLDLEGLHFHLGSPIFELEPYTEAVERVMGFASEMREHGLEQRLFSPGGGFAIAYTEDDDPPPPSAYAEAIVSATKRACADHGMPEPALPIRPGRAHTGPRHTQAFSEAGQASGWLDELRLGPKSLVMTNLSALIGYAPIAIQALTHGKMPPIIHKKLPDSKNVGKIFDKVEGPKKN